MQPGFSRALCATKTQGGLALAKQLQARVLTTDRMWAKLDLGIRIEVVR